MCLIKGFGTMVEYFVRFLFDFDDLKYLVLILLTNQIDLDGI